MKATETHLKGCFLLEPTVFEDHRGYFLETYQAQRFEALTGTAVTFVQDNESFSKRGVLRGLHYQTGDYAQAKLVRVLQGQVLDVAVDLRPGSATYGQHLTMELSAQNKRQLFVPRGFAHGFVVLSATAVFAYKCDNYYHKAAETGLRYNDPDLNINWRLPEAELLLSEKDLELPLFKDLNPNK